MIELIELEFDEFFASADFVRLFGTRLEVDVMFGEVTVDGPYGNLR